MLDAHPDLAIPPETHFIPDMTLKYGEAVNPRECFLQTIMSRPRWPDFHIDGELLKQRIADINPFNLSDALRAFYRMYAERFGKPRWGDKTPPYIVSMSLIQKLLPEARFIHIIRDGRDVALSINHLWWGPNSIQETAKWWMSRINEARRQVNDLQYYLEIRYEDLVLETEFTLRKLCNFIDLSWDPIMLDYYKRAKKRMAELDHEVMATDGAWMIRAEDRRRVHSLTSRPPEANRIARWKNEMGKADRKEFKEIAGEMLQEFGYETG